MIVVMQHGIVWPEFFLQHQSFSLLVCRLVDEMGVVKYELSLFFGSPATRV